jgi:hypothetical protein
MFVHASPGIARTAEQANAFRRFLWHYTSPSKKTFRSGAISQEDLLSEGREEGQGIILINDQGGIRLKRYFPRLFRGPSQCSADFCQVFIEDYFLALLRSLPPASTKNGLSPELS